VWLRLAESRGKQYLASVRSRANRTWKVPAMLNARVKAVARQALKGLGYELIRYDPVRHEPYNQDLAIQGKIVCCDIGGIDVYFFVMDEQDEIQREHLHRRFYEPEELQIIKQAFNGGVFLDVGSNVGNHALFAAMFLGASKVISVEPNPIAYRILRVNIGLNGLHEKIMHHAVGLSDASCRAAIHMPRHNLGGAQLVVGSADGAIDVVTGDELLGGAKVDFIKIDAEGMELNVIRGLSKTIARDHPNLFVEVDGENAAAFLDLMKTHGYAIKQRYRRYDRNENYLAVPG
jgi:FkbM family methyltransferase